jgi:epoxyqueuosine reductase
MGENAVAGIKELAREVGFSGCGITSAEPFEDFKKALEEQIRRFPGAASLYKPLLKYAVPRSTVPWAQSIVVCVRRYGKYKLPEGLAGYIGRNYLFDKRIKECPDYVMSEKMAEGLKGMGFRVRKGGVADRWAGARAGVTQFGRNCFAYSEHGSWINIETWLVEAKLPADKPQLQPACPANCRACINACPTNALVEPFVMRMDRCIAHLTFKAPEPIPSGLWNRMGTWIYGCDKCQEACPLNKGKWEPVERAFWLEKIAPFLMPEALATMDRETYQNIVQPRFWYIPVENLSRWHKNAARALNCRIKENI